MGSILLSLLYIFCTNFTEVLNPSFDKDLVWIDWSGIPYFFGISLFMFEGNATAMEIYH